MHERLAKTQLTVMAVLIVLSPALFAQDAPREQIGTVLGKAVFRDELPASDDAKSEEVLHRVFISQGDAKRYSLQKDLWELSEALIPPGNAYDFNQALMDFGATVCTARKPVCLICPLQEFCKAFPCTP